MATPDPIAGYIDAAPVAGRAGLREIRALARKLFPEAEEAMSYRLPAFKHDRVFLYYAAFSNHIGIYPPVEGNAALIKKLAKYRGPKGNLQFSYDEDLPLKLIEEVIKALHKAYAVKK
jgi:uncharacterized protein YdhG (YjbR/CyaY superfamily)